MHPPVYIPCKVLGGLPVEVAVTSQEPDPENGVSEKLVDEWDIVRVGKSDNQAVCSTIKERIIQTGHEKELVDELTDIMIQLIWESKEP